MKSRSTSFHVVYLMSKKQVEPRKSGSTSLLSFAIDCRNAPRSWERRKIHEDPLQLLLRHHYPSEYVSFPPSQQLRGDDGDAQRGHRKCGLRRDAATVVAAPWERVLRLKISLEPSTGTGLPVGQATEPTHCSAFAVFFREKVGSPLAGITPQLRISHRNPNKWNKNEHN